MLDKQKHLANEIELIAMNTQKYYWAIIDAYIHYENYDQILVEIADQIEKDDCIGLKKYTSQLKNTAIANADISIYQYLLDEIALD